MKFVKPIVWTIAGLVALLAIGIVMLFAFIDPNEYKSQLTQIVKEKKQRTLLLNGNLKLTIFPTLGIDLGKASLSEFRNEKIFASVDSAKIGVELLPLLHKQLNIDRIELKGLKAQFHRDKNGKTNLDDLLSKDEQESEKIKFDIKGIDIEKAQAEIHDEMTHMQVRLESVEMHSGHIANNVPSKISLRADLIANEPRAAANLMVDSGFVFDLDAKRVELSDLNAKLEHAKFKRGNLDLSETHAQLKAKKLALDLTALTIAVDELSFDGTGKYQGNVCKLSLTAPQVKIDPRHASGDTIVGTLSLPGKQSLDAKWAISGLSGDAKNLAIRQILVEAQAKEETREVAIKLDTPITIKLEPRIIEMAQMKADIQASDPALPQKSLHLPLTASVSGDLAQQTLHVKFATRFDESNIQGAVGVQSFAKPAIDFDVRVDKFNLDRYVTPAPASAGKVSEEGAPAIEKPIDLSVLKTLNLKGKARVGNLQANRLKATNVELTLKAQNGILNLAPITANLYQGSVGATASVNANTNSYATHQEYKNIDIHPLLIDLAQKDILEGHGNVFVDVSGRGSAVGAIKKSLAGTANLMLRDGAYKGINLAKSLRDIQSKIGLRKNEAQRADKTEKTDFSELTASFKINNGVAHNDDLSGKSPFVRVGGSGDIDIGNNRVDYLLKAIIVNTATGQGGKELSQLRDVAVPIRIVGPLDNFKYNIEWSSMSSQAFKEVLKPKLEEQKKELREKAREQLKDKLKGLFK